MCKPASFVIADNGKKAFWSKYTDSHEEIIQEFGLIERVAGKITFVRVEISPESEILTDLFDLWVFKTDQNESDVLPEWYDPAEAEKLCRAELPAWFESKVFVDGEHEICKGTVYAYANSHVSVKGNASARLFDNASARLFDNASAQLYDNASARLYDNASARLYDNASATKLSLKCKCDVSGWAVCIDRSHGKPVIYVAGE